MGIMTREERLNEAIEYAARLRKRYRSEVAQGRKGAAESTQDALKTHLQEYGLDPALHGLQERSTHGRPTPTTGVLYAKKGLSEALAKVSERNTEREVIRRHLTEIGYTTTLEWLQFELSAAADVIADLRTMVEAAQAALSGLDG